MEFSDITADNWPTLIASLIATVFLALLGLVWKTKPTRDEVEDIVSHAIEAARATDAETDRLRFDGVKEQIQTLIRTRQEDLANFRYFEDNLNRRFNELRADIKLLLQRSLGEDND